MEVEFPLEEQRQVALYIAERNDISVKSQQRGEPELSVEERMEIIMGVLAASPSRFLARWGRYMRGSAKLDYFRGMEDVEVQFYLRDICQPQSVASVRNRRLKYINTVFTEENPYFSLEEMQRRSPYLYHHYVGQHMTEAEVKLQLSRDAHHTLSHHLLQQMDSKKIRMRQEQSEGFPDLDQEPPAAPPTTELPTTPDDDIEEFDTDSDEEMTTDEASQSSGKGLSAEEKEALRGEFMRIMRERFLDGYDEDFFDYSTVDGDRKLDDMDKINRDCEESYFDE